MKGVRLIVLLPLLLLSSCSLDLILGPRTGGLEFSWEAAHHGLYLPEPELEVAAGRGRIDVHALLSAPDPCQQLTGKLERGSARLTLRVTVRPVGVACVGMIGSFQYDASIRDLAPGTYNLRVIHDYPETGWPSGPVLERQVTVR